jgi:hypothetical protein
MATQIEEAAKIAAQERVQSIALSRARDAAKQARVTQKAAVYTRTLEKVWADEYPIAYREEYAKRLAGSV